MEESQKQEIRLYIENADEMLEVAQVMLNNDFYTSTVNRAYYAIFYAANAMLITKGLASKKHSGVISFFRQYFVKTNIISSHYSNIYGRVMGSRQASDYDLNSLITPDLAQKNLNNAKEFVAEMTRWLKNEGWLS